MNRLPVNFDFLSQYEVDLEVSADSDQSAQMISDYERIRLDDAEQYFKFGMAFLELGGEFRPRAVEAFARVTELRPDWPQTHFYLGLAYAESGERLKAIESYEKVLLVEPDDVVLLGALLHAHMMLGNYSEGAKISERLMELEPELPTTYFFHGLFQLLLGHNPEADVLLSRAIELVPDFAEAHYSLGVIKCMRGMKDDCHAHLEMLRELRPDLAEALARLSGQGNITAAEIVSDLTRVIID